MIGVFTSLRHMFFGLSKTPELGRVLFAMMVLAFIGYQGVAIFLLKQAFNPLEFATGGSALLAGGGAGIALKDRGVSAALAGLPQ